MKSEVLKMRKTTKIFLLISEIVSFVAIGGLAIAAIILIASGAVMIGAEVASGGADVEEMAIVGGVYIAYGIAMFVPAIVSIVTGIICHKTRKQYIAGTTKEEMKGKAIALIILGACSCELPIAAGILLLVGKPETFHD